MTRSLIERGNFAIKLSKLKLWVESFALTLLIVIIITFITWVFIPNDPLMLAIKFSVIMLSCLFIIYIYLKLYIKRLLK